MAPKDALVIMAHCPICDEETITTRHWSTWDDYYGAWEGDGEQEKSCDCPLTENELIGVAENAWESWAAEDQERQRRERATS